MARTALVWCGEREERRGREAAFVLALARRLSPVPPHPSLYAAWAPTPETDDAVKPPAGLRRTSSRRQGGSSLISSSELRRGAPGRAHVRNRDAGTSSPSPGRRSCYGDEIALYCVSVCTILYMKTIDLPT
jgi:hypothetical protein